MSYSIGSVSSSQIGAMRERMQAFQSGKVNVSKDELETLKKNVEAQGRTVPSGVTQLLSSFDTIDTNSDGISVDELQTYAKANGMLLPSGNAPLGGSFGGAGRFPGGGMGHMGGLGGFPGGNPPSLSKDELTSLKDKITSNAQEAADNLGKIIDSFAEVDTDSDGKASASEVKTFAEANGFIFPQGPAFGETSGATNSSSSGDSSTTNSDTSGSDALAGMVSMMMQRMMKSYSAFDSSAQQGLGSFLRDMVV